LWFQFLWFELSWWLCGCREPTLSSRLSETFARLRAEKRPGLVTYTTAGDPDLPRSGGVLKALDRGGADVLEVGVPFSDPLADGPVIQRATERALAAGGSLSASLALVADVRPHVTAPIVIFSYANPLMRMGIDRFARRAAESGVDGVLALDLPIEEADDLHRALREVGLDMVFLLSPTTTETRIRRASELGSGFLYGISRLGVTGARDQVAAGAGALVRRIRAHSALPIALGFGISRPEHVTEVCGYADAAVVGSALVSLIASESHSESLPERVEGFVQWLKGTRSLKLEV
jgi:tryptophan synthase alpha chain